MLSYSYTTIPRRIRRLPNSFRDSLNEDGALCVESFSYREAAECS
jgi:hypothetical protein